MVHEETGDSFDLTKWTVNGGKGGQTLQVTECAGYKLLGGYGQLSKEKVQVQISLANYNY